jgi:hypothetical protein
MSQQQSGRRPAAPTAGQLISPQYRPGVPVQTRAPVGTQRAAIPPQRGGVAPIASHYTNAPTLGQYWRSDTRRTRVDGRRVRWPGLLAFFGGLAAVILLIAAVTAASIALASIALAFSVVAGFFALVAIVAGLGRALGIVGLLLALAGNVYIVQAVLGIG